MIHNLLRLLDCCCRRVAYVGKHSCVHSCCATVLHTVAIAFGMRAKSLHFHWHDKWKKACSNCYSAALIPAAMHSSCRSCAAASWHCRCLHHLSMLGQLHAVAARVDQASTSLRPAHAAACAALLVAGCLSICYWHYCCLLSAIHGA
jgi:hypothetical protein